MIVAGLNGDTNRLTSALKLGATHTVNVEKEDLEEVVRSISPIGADLICEASGASRPLDIALRLARPDGQVPKVGWSPDPAPIDMNPLVQKNVRLQGSFSHTFAMWEKVIHLLTERLMMPDEIVGLKTGVGDWENAFESMHSGRVIKSVIVPGD